MVSVTSSDAFELFVGVLSHFHLRMQLFADFLRYLYLLLKFVDLLKCLLQLHLQVVSLEDDRLQVELLPAYHVFL